MNWIDVSIPLRDGLIPWPGDPPFAITRVCDMGRGDISTFSTLAMSAHAGTHIDAPLHFLADGAAIHTLPLDTSVGAARVLLIPDCNVIGEEELRAHRIRSGERLLLKTRNSNGDHQAGEFFEDYVAISPDGARYLAACGIRMVGIDGPSIGPFREGMVDTHRALLGAGVWVIEGLNLRDVPEGRCHFICLPLRIIGADGAPARAILRPRRSQ